MTGKIRIGIVFWQLRPFGGVIFPLDILKQLDINRYEITIFTPDTKQDPTGLDIPFEIKTLPVEQIPIEISVSSDIAIATLWITTYIVKAAKKTNSSLKTVYFIQDYEPRFMEPAIEITEDPIWQIDNLRTLRDSCDFSEIWPIVNRLKKKNIKDVILETYGLLDVDLTHSQWLEDTIHKATGTIPLKIPPFVQTSQFHPLPTNKNDQIRICALAKPTTYRRGFPLLKDILSRIYQHDPTIEIVLFGSKTLQNESIPFQYVDLGIVPHPNIHEIYQNSNFFIDASIFQGLGLPGLESMACGCIPILSNSGGIREYAINYCNSIIYDQPEDAKNAIIMLCQDKAIREYIIESGVKTAQKLPIQATVESFEKIIR